MNVPHGRWVQVGLHVPSVHARSMHQMNVHAPDECLKVTSISQIGVPDDPYPRSSLKDMFSATGNMTHISPACVLVVSTISPEEPPVVTT